MNEKQILQELNADRQRAPASKVIYLEGKTDTPIFFALLGRSEPRDGLHQGVLVKPLEDRSGMGGTSVHRRVALAQHHGYPGIFGIVDGDGKPLSHLANQFDAPYGGPLFTWKCYSIENLLVKTGWPSAWGMQPDWHQVFLSYAPYVGLNHIHRDVKDRLETLNIARFSHPKAGTPLLTIADVEQALHRDRTLIHGYDVAAQFQTKVAEFEKLVQTNVDEVHTLIDGKWLTNAFAPTHCGRSIDHCRQEWIAHAIATGGLAEVCTLWQRVIGKLP